MSAVRTVPEGYTAVTPWLISRDTAALLDFLAEAFGAVEHFRMHNEDGSIGHAEAQIGDARVMLFDSRPHWPETPTYLRLYVADLDATYGRARALGAEAITDPTELYFGDRVARVRDPWGNVWWLHERVADPTPEELAERAQRPEFIEAMRYVQSAKIFPNPEPAPNHNGPTTPAR